MTEKVSDSTLEKLYLHLDSLNLTPEDVVRELRRDGAKIGSLEQLTEIQARTLIRDCEKAKR